MISPAPAAGERNCKMEALAAAIPDAFSNPRRLRGGGLVPVQAEAERF